MKKKSKTKDMSVIDEQPITLPKQQYYVKPLFGLILCLLLIVTFISGYWIANIKIGSKKQERKDLTVTSSSKEAPAKFIFIKNIDSSFILLTSPGFTNEIRGKSFEAFQCLRSVSSNTDSEDNNITVDRIKAGASENILISGLEKIQNNEYDYLARSYKEDGITIDKEKMIKTKADINLYSVCKDQENYYFLYNANISWSSIDKQLFSLNPKVNATGGPQYVYVPYLAQIIKTGEVKFFKLTNDSKKDNFFTPISVDILKQYGYSGERRTDMLFPQKLMGKVDNTIFVSFETRCYECRDNPMERSLYAFSLNTLNAKEISFCRNYESSEQVCYDHQGIFASVKE